MAIDMHAHWIPEELYSAMQADGLMPRKYDALDNRLADMDARGYSHAVLSCVDRSIESMPLAESLKYCRIYNEATAGACSEHPDRFSGLASLPSADMEVMIEEFDHYMSMPGMVGAVLPGDGFLTLERAERYRPLFAAANQKGALFLVHYGRLADDPEGAVERYGDNRGLRTGSLDMQARLSQNMITFCLTDFLADYPNVTVLSHNLGGNITFEVERMDHRTLVDQPAGTELPSSRLRAARLLVDCNSFGARGIEMAVAVYGAEKIVCGSDGTDFGMDWTNRALDEARISEEEKNLIREGNAMRALANSTSSLAVAT
jgi:predicted TIM-barrel fold metal-dependent hydrolase